jgi:hypothetical protein
MDLKEIEWEDVDDVLAQVSFQLFQRFITVFTIACCDYYNERLGSIIGENFFTSTRRAALFGLSDDIKCHACLLPRGWQWALAVACCKDIV